MAGYFADDLSLLPYGCQHLEFFAVAILNAVGDGDLFLEVVIEDGQCLGGVEITFLRDGGLVACIVRCIGIGADACLCAGCAVEDILVHREVVGVGSRRARVIHLDGLQQLIGADEIAPVVAVGLRVAVHECLVCNAVEEQLVAM